VKFNTSPFTSNQPLMMERSVSGVQSIIYIHCKKKNDSAFKCLASGDLGEVTDLTVQNPDTSLALFRRHFKLT
jgi:hypothetical protein